MSTCSHCGKEIGLTEPSEVHTMDGDFIHIACKKAYAEKMDRICNMSDKEFTDYIGGM